jgi:L-ascorbate metabolism protein UlaG (beta-lactamase superfamily)
MLKINDVITLSWFGHASFKLKTEGKIIYFDPWKIKKGEVANLILITHPHFDHLSQDDIRHIQKKETVIITTKDSASKLKGDITTVKPGDNITFDDIQIETIHAYNIGKNYHPKTNGWIGFIVSVGGKRVYHAGGYGCNH